MAIEDIGIIILEVGKIANWLKAVGILLIFWIIFDVINLWMNRKKRKAIYRIEEDLKRVEKKVDRLLSKKR